jgi:hypothetical protein
MKAAIVEQNVLDGQPIRAVSYLEPEDQWDSGFAIWTSPPDTTGDSVLVHVDCLLDSHPEIGEGMDLARKHGEAIRDRDGNRWHPPGGWVDDVTASSNGHPRHVHFSPRVFLGRVF